jgi:hypothetical protein
MYTRAPECDWYFGKKAMGREWRFRYGHDTVFFGVLAHHRRSK